MEIKARLDSKRIALLYLRHVQNGFAIPSSVQMALNRLNDDAIKAFLRDYVKVASRNVERVKRWRELLKIEKSLWREGYELIAGVDEVGVAPLAGPVLAAAVILPKGCRLLDVDDSKKLQEKERERLAAEIKRAAIAWGIGSASPAEIDKINILQADLLAMRRAVRSLEKMLGYKRPGANIGYVLVDYHEIPNIEHPQLGITDGDQKSLSIAAASIIAKTTRDELMRQYDRLFPGYDFSKNKGYGSQTHKAAILSLGVLPIHRRTFRSVREAINAGVPLKDSSKTNYDNSHTQE